jgi:hypothetical protein
MINLCCSLLCVRCYTIIFLRSNIEQNEFYPKGNFEQHIRKSYKKVGFSTREVTNCEVSNLDRLL